MVSRFVSDSHSCTCDFVKCEMLFVFEFALPTTVQTIDKFIFQMPSRTSNGAIRRVNQNGHTTSLATKTGRSATIDETAMINSLMDL